MILVLLMCLKAVPFCGIKHQWVIANRNRLSFLWMSRWILKMNSRKFQWCCCQKQFHAFAVLSNGHPVLCASNESPYDRVAVLWHVLLEEASAMKSIQVLFTLVTCHFSDLLNAQYECNKRLSFICLYKPFRRRQRYIRSLSANGTIFTSSSRARLVQWNLFWICSMRSLFGVIGSSNVAL